MEFFSPLLDLFDSSVSIYSKIGISINILVATVLVIYCYRKYQDYLKPLNKRTKPITEPIANTTANPCFKKIQATLLFISLSTSLKNVLMKIFERNSPKRNNTITLKTTNTTFNTTQVYDKENESQMS